MKKFEKEILAYSLQNALEHGKADPSKILPKLFQHGLEKEKISEVMPFVKKITSKVNSMSKKERESLFESHEEFVKKREEKKKDLVELPNLKKKMVFRLAPFPSGALHIGNAKTYVLNALYAEKYGADLLLVMDDTIGSAEKPLLKKAYKMIQDAFDWLEVKYDPKIIYKSDRLKIYYDYAQKLIKKNKAYVCYCTQDELRENRKKGVECGCRKFPPKIQLLRWKEMFKAKEGHAVLRIKTSMLDPNPAFRDRVLFKISDRKHPRVGNKYRVWPSLEMSWAIDDHLLGITHILRGNELVMETKMEEYIWDIFKWKRPEVIHTGLIKLEGAVGKISKSKARKEVLSGEYVGWEDPRTWSIQSLRKRGISSKSIREFVKEIGLNRQDITVPIDALYAINRSYIDKDAERYSFIENPVEIIIKNIPSGEIQIPLHPEREETRLAKVSEKVFVSKSDFEKLKGKEVRLLHLFNVKLKQKTKTVSDKNKNIPRINWVSDKTNAKILMPDATWISGFADSAVLELKKGSMIQFERFGFCKYEGREKDNSIFWFAHK